MTCRNKIHFQSNLPQWLWRIVQQPLDVLQRRLNQLLAPRRIYLERPRHRFELEERAAQQRQYSFNNDFAEQTVVSS